MLSTRIRQKDGIFYFVSFKARDILNRVKFTSRFYFEGETIEADVHSLLHPGLERRRSLAEGALQLRPEFRRVVMPPQRDCVLSAKEPRSRLGG